MSETAQNPARRQAPTSAGNALMKGAATHAPAAGDEWRGGGIRGGGHAGRRCRPEVAGAAMPADAPPAVPAGDGRASSRLSVMMDRDWGNT